MTKIWNEAFWKADPEAVNGTDSPPHNARVSPAEIPSDGGSPGPLPLSTRMLYLLPLAALVALTVAMGIGAQYVFELTDHAAAQLLDPAAYIDAVLGVMR